MKPGKQITPLQIALYYPNLMDYLRIACALVGLSFALRDEGNDWIVFLALYVFAVLLDVFDGMAARACNQCSRLGCMLDMVTDRSSSTMLLALIMVQISNKPVQILILVYILADYASHFFKFCGGALTKSVSHKDTGSNDPFLVQLYYGNYPFFANVVVASEVCPVSLVIISKSEMMYNSYISWVFVAYGTIGWLTKMIVNFYQFQGGLNTVERHDRQQLKVAA